MPRRSHDKSETSAKSAARDARKEAARFVPYGSAAPMAGPDLQPGADEEADTPAQRERDENDDNG